MDSIDIQQQISANTKPEWRNPVVDWQAEDPDIPAFTLCTAHGVLWKDWPEPGYPKRNAPCIHSVNCLIAHPGC